MLFIYYKSVNVFYKLVFIYYRKQNNYSSIRRPASNPYERCRLIRYEGITYTTSLHRTLMTKSGYYPTLNTLPLIPPDVEDRLCLKCQFHTRSSDLTSGKCVRSHGPGWYNVNGKCTAPNLFGVFRLVPDRVLRSIFVCYNTDNIDVLRSNFVCLPH